MQGQRTNEASSFPLCETSPLLLRFFSQAIFFQGKSVFIALPRVVFIGLLSGACVSEDALHK